MAPPAAVAVAILLASLAACGPPPPSPRAGWAGAEGDVAELLRGDFAALQNLADLTAEVRLTVTHEQGRQAADSSILFRPPDLLRLDVQGPLFRHVLTAVVDADTLFALAEGRLAVVPAVDGLDFFLDIDLGGYDPRWALLGVVAPGTPDSVAYPRADRAVLWLDAGGGRARMVSMNLHRGFVDREEVIDVDGTVLWRRRLASHRRLPGTDVYLPASVRIEGQGRRLQLDYGQVRVDRGLRREAFFSGLR